MNAHRFIFIPLENYIELLKFNPFTEKNSSEHLGKMIFEFTSKPDFDFIVEFSAQFIIPVFDNCLTIPASMGKGYIKRIVFGTDFRLIIHRY
ncbi:MAG: hypothetical protein BGO52_07600 [Sphingobacteriales bacterium 44-61]|nr:MAG: hypothetical protein BGO52_07600 [Sphingobacteriales bacterium 44-61]